MTEHSSVKATEKIFIPEDGGEPIFCRTHLVHAMNNDKVKIILVPKRCRHENRRTSY